MYSLLMRNGCNGERSFILVAVLSDRGSQELEQPFVVCQQWAGDAWSSCRGWGAHCDREIVLKTSGKGEPGRSSQLSGAVSQASSLWETSKRLKAASKKLELKLLGQNTVLLAMH